jgi:hypothetical protein
MRPRGTAQAPEQTEARAPIVEPFRAPTRHGAGLQLSRLAADGLVRSADRFLSSRTVSAMTGDASKRKIRAWVDRGEFSTYALDGKTVYSEREVLDFLERVKAKGPSRAPWRGTQSAASGERPSNAPKE